MNEKQIKALARRNAAKAARVKPSTTQSYDRTVDATRPPDRDDTDANRIFKEMKRREF
ncbi:MAG: hypothetical protein HUU26_09910 [Gemmatimonadaceae bacterium]|nr:hypothetical protein [Gemmatimonadaceae bacterium]